MRHFIVAALLALASPAWADQITYDQGEIWIKIVPRAQFDSRAAGMPASNGHEILAVF